MILVDKEDDSEAAVVLLNAGPAYDFDYTKESPHSKTGKHYSPNFFWSGISLAPAGIMVDDNVQVMNFGKIINAENYYTSHSTNEKPI